MRTSAAVTPMPGLIVPMLLFGFGFMWLMARRPQGHFRVTVDTPERFAFSSECGEFSLDHATGTLSWKHEDQRASTKLANMARRESMRGSSPCFAGTHRQRSS